MFQMSWVLYLVHVHRYSTKNIEYLDNMVKVERYQTLNLFLKRSTHSTGLLHAYLYFMCEIQRDDNVFKWLSSEHTEFAFVTKWRCQPLYPETGWGRRGNTRSADHVTMTGMTADMQDMFYDLLDLLIWRLQLRECTF